MNRTVIAFHIDENGDWVADLDCGHRQHVRHQPPFANRPWVLSAAGRQSRLGAELDCRHCNDDDEK
jgi:hypothetical protein